MSLFFSKKLNKTIMEDKWIDEDRRAVFNERYGEENYEQAMKMFERVVCPWILEVSLSMTPLDTFDEWNTFSRYEMTRLVKARYQSLQSFITREMEPNWAYKCADGLPYPPIAWLLKYMERNWEVVEPYSLVEMFEEPDQRRRTIMFRFITPQSVMETIGAERIATEGVEVKYETGVTNNNIYELYKGDIAKIDSRLEGDIFAVKCWCTSTNKEAWLFVEEEYATDPLTAIASTFRVNENVIPFIQSLKRQGDILLTPFSENVKPEGPTRPLTKEEYFGLLVMEA